MTGKKVLCFGELLIRMSPEISGGWLNHNSMPAYVGGAELNVATALANWEIPSSYFTALPDNSLSHDLIQYMKHRGIDGSSINFSGNRIGIYFLPQGSDLKNAGVIYDRENSSFAELKPEMIDWELLLKEVSWLHISAISPALNENAAEVCKQLVIKASEKNITISLDLNFRSKLWKYGKKPVEVMPQIVEHCDLVMGNIWAAEDLLGISVEAGILQDRNKTACLEHAVYTSQEITRRFPKVMTVANTFRFDRSGDRVNYYATLYKDDQLYVSDEFNAINIVDKIGSGDCFMAGLILGFYKGLNEQEIINFSSASAVGKMYEKSDATNQTIENILLRVTKNKGQKNEQTTIITE